MSIDVSLTLDAVRLAMGLERARANVLAHNIAMANVAGNRAARLDLTAPLAQLSSARGDSALFAQTLKALAATDTMAYRRELPVDQSISLDAEVAELSAASGRFQALADGVSRQFALMQLAARGGR